MDTWKVHPIRWVGYSSIYSSELHAVVQELELELVSGAGIGAGVGVGEGVRLSEFKPFTDTWGKQDSQILQSVV
jgi:hypothetical protein